MLDNLDPLAHADGAPAHLSREAELVVGDLRDRDAVDRALDGVDRVFHLGGVVGNGESMINVRRAVDANSGGTATLLEAVLERRDRIRRMVAASSMVVYGEGSYRCREHGLAAPPPRPAEQLVRRDWEPRCDSCGAELEPVATHETAPLRPASVYGITKRDQEELVLVLGRAYGLETVALRYLNVYGPRQALSNPYTGVAAIFAARLLNGRRTARVRGRPPDPRPRSRLGRRPRHTARDGRAARPRKRHQRRDRPTRARGGARDTRSPKRSSVELDPEITGEGRAGDIRHCFADVSRARDLLGFDARRSLAEGLPELAEWVATQEVDEDGDRAVSQLRARGLVG